MNQKWTTLLNHLLVFVFGLALLMGSIFAIEIVLWQIAGVPMMRLPFYIVGAVFTYCILRVAKDEAGTGKSNNHSEK